MVAEARGGSEVSISCDWGGKQRWASRAVGVRGVDGEPGMEAVEEPGG